MRSRRGPWSALLVLACVVVGCSGGRAPAIEILDTPVATAVIQASATPSATPTAEPTAAPRVDMRASRLAIPALGIDAPVQSSRVVVDNSPPTPGCPGSGGGGETLTVPDQGIATPEVSLDGLDGSAWVFGHSRWLNQPGVLFRLQDLNLGDEVYLDGVDRTTGAPFTGRRFVVDGLFLTDIDSGSKLVFEGSPARSSRPVVFLQTSAREDGANKQWLLDRAKVVSKSHNLIEGDVNDPCKYLLLFARAS